MQKHINSVTKLAPVSRPYPTNMDPSRVEEIRQFLENNHFPENCSSKERYYIKRRCENFTLKDGQLHYICKRKKDKSQHLAKVVLSPNEAHNVFIEFHAGPLGGHCGVEKTHNAIILRFYWPGMEQDIRKWIAQCPQCQTRRKSIKEKKAYNPITVSEPLELVGMDLIGKLTPTENGHQYICVMVDYFTKWSEAYPLKTKTAEEVTQCIVDFFYKFGAPKRILTDQGREFVNKVNFRLCDKLGITGSLCSPYHPQTNGLVERMNGTIQRSLTKMVGENPSSWHHHLSATIFALRTKKQITTQFSPYYLMFGREARYPSEVPMDYDICDGKVEAMVATEELFEGLSDRAQTMEAVKKNISKSQDKVRKRKVEKGEEDNFVVGDKVLVRNVRQENRKGGKMDPDMLGPFTITNIEDKIVDVVSKKGKKTMKFNSDHLIKYVEPEPHVPKKWISSQSHSTPCPPSPPGASDSTPRPASPPGASDRTPCPGSPPGASNSTPHPASPPSATTTSPVASHPPPPLPSSQVIPSSPSTHPNWSPDTIHGSDFSEERVINSIWQEKKQEVLWSKIGSYKLFTANMMELAPGNQLESEVVNAYLHHLKDRINKSGRKRAYFIDSYQMTAFWKGSQKGLKKLDPSSYDVLFGPICHENHWTFIAMFPKLCKSVYIDPFGAKQKDIDKCKDVTRCFMRMRGLNLSRWGCHSLDHPTQQDSTSCGAFVCKLAETILMEEEMALQSVEKGAASMRMELAKKLLRESDDLSQLCHCCGEKDKGQTDQWIECTQCGRWYHWDCVDRPCTAGKYTCPACV